MAEHLVFTRNLLNSYFEIYSLAVSHGMEVAEAMSNGMFVICKATLKNSENFVAGHAAGWQPV